MYIYVYIYIYIYNIVEKSPNSSQMYDHGFMDVIPIVRQWLIDFIHKQVILHGWSHFDYMSDMYMGPNVIH